MTLRVGPFRGSGGDWDAFVRSQQGWTHFHRYGWKRVIERVFGHDTQYACARCPNGELAGVLPLVRVRSFVFGDYLVSMPFLNYGGPLGEDEAVAELSRWARDRARKDGVELLELRSRRPLNTDLEPSHRKIAVLLDLPDGDPELLWDDLKSKVRSQVRRPRKEGIDVHFGHDQIAPFFEVFSTHMRNLGTPTQPRELFETIAGEFGDDVWVGCAYHDGKPVACGYGLQWMDEFEMTWASDLFEYRKMAPNMLLYWKFMERCIEDGLSVFNFGRCTPGSGTHRFKQQWGTRDQKLWWYQYAENGADATPSPEDDRWSWGPRVWRKLPMPVANALGPMIVQYIP